MPFNPAYYFPQQYQPAQYQPQMPQMQPVQPQMQQPQAMTPPIRQASIIQISALGDEDQITIQPGSPQMFMTADDLHIVIKTLTPNGASKIYFDKRPPAPEEAPFNPSEYVRKDEIEKLVAGVLAAKEAAE